MRRRIDVGSAVEDQDGHIIDAVGGGERAEMDAARQRMFDRLKE
jgi:hypothetical protein